MNKQSDSSWYQFDTYNFEMFDELSLRQRILGLLALTFFNLSFAFFLHLSIHSVLIHNETTEFLEYALYVGTTFLSVLAFSPIVFPKLRKLRKSIIGILQFLILGVLLYLFFQYKAGALSIYFSASPDKVNILLMIGGMTINATSMYIYGAVMRSIFEENARKDTEIQFAQKIQSQLVPTINQTTERYQIFGRTESAYEVGGDFFDSLHLSDDKLILSIADVTGHDIAAGLLMAISKGSFRTAIQHSDNLPDLGQAMNKTIYENSDRKMFVSFSTALLNFSDSTISFLNAGHLPALHYQAKTKSLAEWNPAGMAYGLMSKASFKEERGHFERGDVFVLMTDGIVEMANSSGEEFGFERVKQIVQDRASDFSPKEIYDDLILELNRFCGFRAIDDDISFISLKIL